MKTPQQIFKSILHNWGKIDHRDLNGICVILCKWPKTATEEERSAAITFLHANFSIAKKEFGASGVPGGYWWDRRAVAVRKEFVTYLSKL